MKKQTTGLLLIGVALLIIVAISLAYQTSAVPHSSCKMAYARVEGMEGSSFIQTDDSDPTDSISWLDEEKKGNGKKDAVKVEGFELHPASVGDSAPIDYFSTLPSGNCGPSIYTTARGYLCLDDKAMRLLKTRGGNITSGESQIGV